jgi:hypothetical protein
MKKHLLEGLQGELTFENVLVFMAILNEIQTKLSKLKTMENSFIEEVVKEEDTLCTSNLPKNLKESGYDYLDKEVITIYQTGLNQPMSQSDQTPIIDQQKALSRFEQEGRKRVEAYLQNNPSLQKYKDIVLLEDKKDLENDFYV